LNSLRIIGGRYRRRILRFPDSEGLRPTASVVSISSPVAARSASKRRRAVRRRW
jgi:hypothetical protein